MLHPIQQTRTLSKLLRQHWENLLTVRATDPEDSALRYSIMTTQNEFVIEPFDPNTAKEATIRVAGGVGNMPLDFETNQQHVFIVQAVDSSNLSCIATVTVQVSNVNDNDPIPTQTDVTFTVLENQPNAQVSQPISAVDADAGTTLSYSIRGTNQFTINSAGQISTLGALDYEKQNQYIFSVDIQDSGSNPRHRSVRVTVNVLDEDDNVPEFAFNTYTGSLLEGLPASTQVLVVTAIDPDNTPVITYQIEGTPNVPFAINPSTGAITTQSLDYEAQRIYSFFVTTQGANLASQLPLLSYRAFVKINVLSIKALAFKGQN